MNLEKKIATRQSYGEALGIIGENNRDIIVLDADLSGATKTNIFAKKFPERFFNIGIAEQDMLATAAGFATCGKIPFASTFAVFACGRGYDQIRNSICYPNLNVKICGTHAGITVGEDGATHQMLEDINLMRALPNMKIICPSDDIQTKWAIKEASKINGPVYVRLNRLATPIIYNENQEFVFGKAVQFGDGNKATVFATGDMVPEALLAIKPIDEDIIIKSAKETDILISIEDHNVIGGLGSAIADVLVEKYPKKLLKLGMKDCFGKSGKAQELLKYFKLNSEEIIKVIKENTK